MFSPEHVVPILREIFGGRLSYSVFVFDQENGFIAPERDVAVLAIVCLGRSFHPRQVDLEGRAAAGLAMQKNVSIALFNNAKYYSEAKAGALSLFFCGAEGFKDLSLGFCAHTTTVVAYRNHGVASRLGWSLQTTVGWTELRVTGFDENRPAAGSGIHRIDDEIHHDLFHLAGVYFFSPESIARHEAQFDIFRDEAFEHL